MTVIEIASIAGAVAASGAYLRLAVRPVIFAFWIGRRFERLSR